MPNELTQKQLNQQDDVDNAILDLVQRLADATCRRFNSLGDGVEAPAIEHDMERIARISKAIAEWLDIKYGLSSMDFYPFIDE